MSKSGKKIPPKIEAELLFNNDRTCCICRNPDKDIQIHHIDGNKNNNNYTNLAVVCIEDHNKIHKKGGFTKGISKNLVRRYKKEWEMKIKYQWTIAQTKHKLSIKVEHRQSEIKALNDDDILIVRLFLLNHGTKSLKNFSIGIVSSLISVKSCWITSDYQKSKPETRSFLPIPLHVIFQYKGDLFSNVRVFDCEIRPGNDLPLYASMCLSKISEQKNISFGIWATQDNMKPFVRAYEIEICDGSINRIIEKKKPPFSLSS